MPSNPKPRATRANAKPAATKAAAKPETDAKPDDKPDAAEAAVSRGLARDASTVSRNATHFEQYSDRDTAYLRFFGTVMRANNGTATLAQIHAAGKAVGNKRRNPFYAGSAKATDAGAINRLRKAGYITVSADGDTLTITEAGKSQKAYSGK